MRTEDKVQAQQSHLGEGMRLVLNQESTLKPRSSRSSSRSSDKSYSSDDGSRSPSVTRRSQRELRQGSSYSSSSSFISRSRSHPRCCRASARSRCRHRSRSYSPYRRHSSRYVRRSYSRSTSRSSSRERYYRRSRRSCSRSSRYRRTRDVYAGKFGSRFSPLSPTRYNRSKSRSPECSIRLSQKDKMDLLNVARENAVKILGVEAKLPVGARCLEEQGKKALVSETEKRVRADLVPAKTPLQDEGVSDEDFWISRTSPARKPISFSISNAVAKPSSSPTLHITESKVTSRADSVGNRKPYGRWIPVKTVYTKKR